MSDYKLVPIDPAPEMVEAAEDAYMPFGDMEMAIRMALLAAPAVQGEPVYLYRRRGLHDFVTCNHDRYAELSVKPHLFETKVLYTAPQPAEQQPTPDVPGLTEALRQYQHNDGRGLVFGYDKLLVDQYVVGLVEALEQGFPLLSDEGLDEVEHHCEWVIQRERKRVHSILAAHRKQRPAPDVTQLVEAAAAALDEIEKIMHEAYNSAYPVCCGRSGSECCGSPDPEWSEFDRNTMDRLSPHQRALTAALAPYRKGGEA